MGYFHTLFYTDGGHICPLLVSHEDETRPAGTPTLVVNSDVTQNADIIIF